MADEPKHGRPGVKRVSIRLGDIDDAISASHRGTADAMLAIRRSAEVRGRLRQALADSGRQPPAAPTKA